MVGGASYVRFVIGPFTFFGGKLNYVHLMTINITI